MSGTRLVLESLRWLTGAWLLWSIPRCRMGGHDAGLASDASVVIPARNEEANLPRLLESLAAQESPPAEIIVVDDNSVDATADVARAAGATVITPGSLPEGWTGKCWASWAGAMRATSATLVFLDADTELAPGGLEGLLDEHVRRGGLVSVQPFHLTHRPYERLSAFFNVVSMMGVDAFAPLSHRRQRVGAFGPCLVTDRGDYLAVGGHRAVRSEVVEDVALAQRYTAAGRPVACLGGRGTVSFRMYPGGVGQLIEGWSKNFAAGAGATRALTFVLISVWLSGCLSAGWYLFASVAGDASVPRGTAISLYGAYVLQLGWMLNRIGRFGWSTAIAFPIPLAFFLAVFARSLVLTHVRGEVTWRGRTVAMRRRAPAPAVGRVDEADG